MTPEEHAASAVNRWAIEWNRTNETELEKIIAAEIAKHGAELTAEITHRYDRVLQISQREWEKAGYAPRVPE